MDDNAVPIFAILIIFGAPIAAWIVSRVFAHQERMEMIRRGVTPPIGPPDPWMLKQAAKSAARAGRAWTEGMPPGPYGAYGSMYDPGYYAQHQLRRGLKVACIGLALLIGLSFIGHHDESFEFGPWLLGGLIPLFVGIAQVIGAILSGARFGVVNPPNATPFEAPHASSTGAPTGPPPAYGGWRPGSMPEIEKPASPPDYRG